MAQRYDADGNPILSGGGRLRYDAEGNPIQTGQPAQPSRGNVWRGRAGAAAINAADSSTVGTADEAFGVYKGGLALNRQSMREADQGGLAGTIRNFGGIPATLQALGQRITGTESPQVREARMQGEEQVRSALDTAQTQYPVSSIGGQVAGTLPWLLVGGSGGAKAATTAERIAPIAGRQAPKLLEQMGRGARTGGLFGGAYGYNSGRDGERLPNAVKGAAVGTVTGAAIPVALKGGAPLALGAAGGYYGYTNPGNDDPLAAAGKTAAIGVAAPFALKRAAETQAGRATMNAVDDWLYRRNLVDFDPRFSRANQLNMSIGVPPIPRAVRPSRSTPRFGPPGNYVARRAAQFADRANIDGAELDARIARAQADPRGQTMAEMFGEPGIQSTAAIARMPGRTGALATEQLEARNAGQAARLERDLTGQSEQGAVDFLNERTRDVAEQYFNPLWRQPPSASDEAIFQHFLRRPEVSEAEPAARRTMQGLIARGRLAPEALNDPAQVLHYIKMEIADTAKNPLKVKAGIRSTNNANLNAAVSDISTVLDLMRPGYGRAMQEFQDAIVPREIAKRMASVRGENPNIAASIVRDPDLMRDIRRLGLNDFQQAITDESRLYRNAQRMIPANGSPTAPVGAHMLDEAAQGGAQIPTSREGWISYGINYLRNGLSETRRNEIGQFLLREVSDPTNGLTPQERQQIINELARIQRERAAAAATARATTRGATVSGENATR